MAHQVLVLGGSGMLGSMVAATLARDERLTVTATVRTPALAEAWRRRIPNVSWTVLDVGDDCNVTGLEQVDEHEAVVNAIGVTKPLISEDEAASRQRAIVVNSVFPHRLASRAERAGARVLQIATDCVYSGEAGHYTEDAAHDAVDVYGQSKSLGEAPAPGTHLLRCSIVGPEPGPGKFLLEWLLGQERGAEVNGFSNHQWNGLTTLHFARICRGVIVADHSLPPMQHVVPADTVSKLELLRSIAIHFDRDDLTIRPTEAAIAVDRTLQTNASEINASLWRAAGYEAPPRVDSMVQELASRGRRATDTGG